MQEPFDSVKEGLLDDLTQQEKQEMNASMNSFDLNVLLETLLQFIQTHVFYCPSNELEWP